MAPSTHPRTKKQVCTLLAATAAVATMAFTPPASGAIEPASATCPTRSLAKKRLLERNPYGIQRVGAMSCSTCCAIEYRDCNKGCDWWNLACWGYCLAVKDDCIGECLRYGDAQVDCFLSW